MRATVPPVAMMSVKAPVTMLPWVSVSVPVAAVAVADRRVPGQDDGARRLVDGQVAERRWTTEPPMVWVPVPLKVTVVARLVSEGAVPLTVQSPRTLKASRPMR